MPTLTAVQISAIASQVLCAAGASEGDAKTVADHLADANMTGHDSHGFIRVLQYVRDIRQGWLDPKAQPDVVAESNGLAQVDGHDAFGQVVATFATRLAMEKAREHGISLVTMCKRRPHGQAGCVSGDGRGAWHGGHHVPRHRGREDRQGRAVWRARGPAGHESHLDGVPLWFRSAYPHGLRDLGCCGRKGPRPSGQGAASTG